MAASLFGYKWDNTQMECVKFNSGSDKSAEQSGTIINRPLSLMCSSITSNIQSLMREPFQRRKLV